MKSVTKNKLRRTSQEHPFIRFLIYAFSVQILCWYIDPMLFETVVEHMD